MRLWKTTLPVTIYRLTRGREFGRVGGQSVLLLETTGRRSGRRHTTPVQYLREGELLVVVAANAGTVRPPAWLLSLRADPRARVQIGTEPLDVIAREATDEEHTELWPRFTAVNGYLENAARKAGHRLPILVLSPAQTARTADERDA
jgi:F420H(2)-dependent quinone reductase